MTYEPFATNATSAETPAGYVQVYSNLHTTYNEPSQFVHYMQMDTYDVDQCKYYLSSTPSSKRSC